MLLIFILSISFKQLSWYSASEEGQNSNCNHDESSAINFDFGNWANDNLPNIHERNDHHCAATTGENAISIQRFDLSTLRPGASQLDYSKPHDASQLFTRTDHPSASEQEKVFLKLQRDQILSWFGQDWQQQQSPQKTLFRCDCETTLLYENQEEYFRDLAERASYWGIESTTFISSPPDSTADVTTLTTPIRSVSQPSDVDFESAAPENIPETSPVASCYAPKKRKAVFNQF